MDFTGERYIPNLNMPIISCEHWHRYLYAAEMVKNKKVLDIASGEGYGSNILADSAMSVTGVDISEEAVKHAGIKYKRDNLIYIAGSASKIPVEGSAVFDVVTSFETIEHIDENSQKMFLQEVKRLLKPGGIFIVSTPNKDLYTDKAASKNEFHVKEFYADEFRKFLSGFFKNVDFFGQKVYPVSYIWNEDENDTEYSEYKLAFNGESAAVTKSGKAMMYLLAAASDEKIARHSASLLVDSKEAIFSLRDGIITDLSGRLKKSTDHIKALSEAYKMEKEKNVRLENEISVIKAAIKEN
jgi:O-antigen biosynthesis protein